MNAKPVTVGGPGEPQFLLFVSPDCPMCREVLPSLPVVSQVGQMAPYVISDSGEGDTAYEYRSVSRVTSVVLAPDIVHTYRVPGTPYAVILDKLGVVRAKGTVNNLEQMEGLVDIARTRLQDVRPAVHER